MSYVLNEAFIYKFPSQHLIIYVYLDRINSDLDKSLS